MFFVCPTFLENKTYQEWKYLKDPDAFAVPCDHDYVETILETIVGFAKGTNSLIVLDDCASSQTVKNRASELVTLTFHGRHIGLSTTVVTQQLTSIAKPYRMNVSKWCSFTPPARTIAGIFLITTSAWKNRRRKKDYENFEKGEVRPVGNFNCPSVHAQGCRPLNFFVTL